MKKTLVLLFLLINVGFTCERVQLTNILKSIDWSFVVSSIDFGITCQCKLLGLGIKTKAYLPKYIVEVVREPACFSLIGANLIPNIGLGAGAQATLKDYNFYHVHVYRIPLTLDPSIIPAAAMQALTMLFECSLNPANLIPFYFSEIDPTWYSDFLALIVSPETIAFANPIAISACIADSIAVNSNDLGTSKYFPHCMGSWGLTYPFSGHILHRENRMAAAASAARAIAKMHRIGLIFGYKPDGCGLIDSLLWDKSRFRMQMVYPYVTRLFPIGRSDILWGLPKGIDKGSTYIFVVYQEVSCCYGI